MNTTHTMCQAAQANHNRSVLQNVQDAVHLKAVRGAVHLILVKRSSEKKQNDSSLNPIQVSRFKFYCIITEQHSALSPPTSYNMFRVHQFIQHDLYHCIKQSFIKQAIYTVDSSSAASA